MKSILSYLISLPVTQSRLAVIADNCKISITHTDSAYISVQASKRDNWFIHSDGMLEQVDTARAVFLPRGPATQELRIEVPTTYKGDLFVHISESSSLAIDHWNVGSVTLRSSTTAKVACGNIDSNGEVEITGSAARAFTMGDISGTTVTINLRGEHKFTAGDITSIGNLQINSAAGPVEIQSLTAESVSVNSGGIWQRNYGRIHAPQVSILHSQQGIACVRSLMAESLHLYHCGQGTTVLDEVVVSRLQLDASGQGTVMVRKGKAMSTSVVNHGAVSISLNGQFNGAELDNRGPGTIKVSRT